MSGMNRYKILKCFIKEKRNCRRAFLSLLGFSSIYFGGLNFSELNSFIILFFSHCDSTKVQELLTDENLNERTETGHNLLHIACISGGNVYRFNLMKPTKWAVRPENTQISLGICSVWSGSLLSTWRRFVSLATHKADSEDCSDWVAVQADPSSLGTQVIVLDLLCCGLFHCALKTQFDSYFPLNKEQSKTS